MATTPEPPAQESWQVRRARLAALTKNRPEGDPAIDEARRDLRAATAEDYIRRLVDQAPPLTSEQRARLAALLRPTRDQGEAIAA